jgi:large conductance mechanosensitive channel
MSKTQEKELETAESEVKTTLFTDFINFIKKYGVIGLALGVVVGQAVKSLVDNLVANIINPLLTIITEPIFKSIPGNGNFSSLAFYNIRIGAFVLELINFVILMMIVYFAIRFFLSRFIDAGELDKI